MITQNIEWLQRCRDIAEHLSAADTQEWAFDPSGDRVLLTTETGLELTIRREKRRIVVTGWFGDMHQFVPRQPSADGMRYESVSYRITEDERKDSHLVAKAILRRLLPRYRLGWDETAARYAIHLRREQWEQEMLDALRLSFGESSRSQYGDTIYLRDHLSGISGKAEASAIYGVHVTLRGLSREQALHILGYLEETREQRHISL